MAVPDGQQALSGTLCSSLNPAAAGFFVFV
jgi:hypothetical protein